MDNAMLERRIEILKKDIHEMIVEDNQSGISSQQNMIMQHMIKELHQASYDANTSEKE
ncbi:hypothetical protein [Paenibacillus sp. CMAA1364]